MQPRRLFQFVSPVKVYTEKSELPEFKFRAWPIQTERRSAYERELHGALNKYLDDAEKVAREAGFVQDDRSFATEHFEWLVRRQVEGESIGSIATSPRLTSEYTVRKALTRLRNLLDLPVPRTWSRSYSSTPHP